MTEQAIRSGRKAQELLENETFNTALTKIENEQLWVFKSSKPEETAKREMAWSMIKAIDSLKIELTKTIDNAKVAQRALERVSK
jgi:adenylosuccinate synthase